VAEDSHVPPLPRRVPGESREPGAGPSAPLVLPESVIRRIQAALDAAEDEASPQADAGPAERPASLPRHVPGTGNRTAPLPRSARPDVPASSVRARPEETPTEVFPAVPASGPNGAAALAPLSRARERTHRSRTLAGAVILALALTAAGSLGFLLTRHAGTATVADEGRPGTGGETTVRSRAAAWVAGQLSRTAEVSCDQAMCQALQARGFPAASLLVVEPGKADPLRSRIIVVTGLVRTMLGNRLVTADAPAAIASFGSGSTRIDIRVIARRGAAAYRSGLRADMQARKVAGAELLSTQRIRTSATARSQLADGQVDPRLLVVITYLAAHQPQPVSVVAFGDLAPGASPGIPFRSADLAAPGRTAAAGVAAEMRSLGAFLRVQHRPYRDVHLRSVRLAGGRDVLRIEFAAPSPLGLLAPSAP
jgi:hypothetical protein